MTTPDDEFRTLGPPPGARRKPMREPEGDPREPADRPGRTPTPGGPPAAGQGAPPPRPEPVGPGESFETIPPASGLGRRRDLIAPIPNPPPPSPPVWGFVEPDPAPPTAEPFHPGWTMAEPEAAPHNPWGDLPPEPAPSPPSPRVPGPSPAPPPASRYDSQVDTWQQEHASSPPPPASIPRPAITGGPAAPAASPLWAAPAGPSPSPSSSSSPPARPLIDDGANKTMAIDRVFPALKNPPLTLQFFNTSLRRWSDLGAVRGSFLDLGRATFREWNSNPEDLAEHHVRLMIDEGALFIEPLPSLNGVYIRMKANRPVELRSGARFRIGRHVLAFRAPEPGGEAEPLRSAEGEVFHSRVLHPLGFLDLIGPDGLAYMSHPLTKVEEPGTRIGRGGARCDLALTGDEWVSGEHARVFLNAGRCFLEDLKSTNGTFLQVLDQMEIERGSPLRPDSGDIIALGSYMVRVVEERL